MAGLALLIVRSEVELATSDEINRILSELELLSENEAHAIISGRDLESNRP